MEEGGIVCVCVLYGVRSTTEYVTPAVVVVVVVVVVSFSAILTHRNEGDVALNICLTRYHFISES